MQRIDCDFIDFDPIVLWFGRHVGLAQSLTFVSDGHVRWILFFCSIAGKQIVSIVMYTHLQLSFRLSKSSVVLKEDGKVELSKFLLQDKILENSSCCLKEAPYLGPLLFNMITKHDANLFMVAYASTFCFFLSKNNHVKVSFFHQCSDQQSQSKI